MNNSWVFFKQSFVCNIHITWKYRNKIIFQFHKKLIERSSKRISTNESVKKTKNFHDAR